MHGSSRRLTAAITVALVATTALAGCTDAAQNASGTTFTTIDDLGTIDVNAPINPYNAKASQFGGYNKMQLAWAKNSLDDPNALYPGLAADWDLTEDGTALTVHLQPKAKWSDGTAVTAKDIETSVGLGISQGNNPVAVEIVDDATETLTQPAGAPSSTFVSTMLTIPIVPDSFFGSHIPETLWTDSVIASDPAASADAQSEATTAIATLGKELVTIGPAKDLSSGPFTLTRVNPGEAILEKNPHFYDADEIDPTRVVLKSYSGNEQIWGYLKGNKLDAAPYTSTPEKVLKSILAVDGIESVSGLSQVSASLAFNQEVAPFDNVHVRRGLAYTIDRETVTKIGEPTSGEASRITTGLINPSAELYLGAATADLNPYDPDAAKAAEEFTAAGFTQKSGKWMLASGEPFTVDIQVPNGFSDWIAGGKSITTQLEAAGISSQLESSADYPTYLSDLAEGKFGAAFWLTSLGPGPFAAYQRVYGNPNGWNASGANVAHSAAGENGNWIGSPETEKVDGASVNPGELAASLGHVSADDEKKVVGQLAGLVNDQLPVIQLWDYVNVQFINTNRFTDFPKEDSDVLRLSPGVWMQLGYIKKK